MGDPATGPGIDFMMPNRVATICNSSRTTELVLGVDRAIVATATDTIINGRSIANAFIQCISTVGSDNQSVAANGGLKFPITTAQFGSLARAGDAFDLTPGLYEVGWTFTTTSTGGQVVLRVLQGSVFGSDGPSPSNIPATACGHAVTNTVLSNKVLIYVDDGVARVQLVNQASTAVLTLAASATSAPSFSIRKLSN